MFCDSNRNLTQKIDTKSRVITLTIPDSVSHKSLEMDYERNLEMLIRIRLEKGSDFNFLCYWGLNPGPHMW
jgi:hypothetical protein